MTTWTFMPNWANGYKVTRTYLTEILDAEDGTEQRRALSVWPRKTYEYSVQESGNALRSLHNRIRADQHKTLTIADDVRKVKAATVGSSSITVAARPAWAVPGNTVVFDDGDLRETLTITSTPGTTINFSTALTKAHSVGAYLYAGVTGWLESDLSATRPTNDLIDASIVVQQAPGSELYNAPPVAPVTFNGRELFLTTPNWGEGVSVNIARPMTTVDFEYGRVSRFAEVKAATVRWEATWLGATAAEVKLIEDVFDRAKGRRGEFYMPTGDNDLPLAFNVASGGTGLVVAGTELYDSLLNDRVYKAVYVLMTDGRYFCRQVSNVYTNAGNTVIALDTAVPYALPMSDILLISWLPVCRFSSDSMTTEWLTDEVAQTKLSIQTLPAHAPE